MKIIYDEIFIGCSLSIILKALLSKKKILIIEKSKYLGGAWRNSNENLKNIDLACHLIATQDNNAAKRITNFFKKYNLNVRRYKKKELFYDTEKWMAYGKTGPAMLCDEGWSKLLNVFIDYLKRKKNITILKNTRVRRISITKTTNKLWYKNNYIYFKKLFFPSYCDLDSINLNHKKITLPFKKINNIHYIVEIQTKENKLVKNFQGFWDKNKSDIFDRLSVSFIKKKRNFQKIIICCRLSKNFKNKSYLVNNKLIENFLIIKSLVKQVKINNFTKVRYSCPYRDWEDSKIANKKLKSIKGIVEWLDTRYMGHFITKLLK